MAHQKSTTSEPKQAEVSGLLSGAADLHGHGTRRLLLKPHDAAESLQVSVRKLAELTKRGLVRAVRIDRSVRYDPADLAAFIAGMKSGGAS